MICFDHTPRPSAIARIRGATEHSTINGTISFYPIREGIIVTACIHGLPIGDTGPGGRFFALHIHEGTSCTGENFSNSGSHLDLCSTPHPHHTGDLPPLLACHGQAYAEFWTDQFRICDILGRTIIIHEGPDDFHTQPSGNAGRKIACGKILRNCCR